MSEQPSLRLSDIRKGQRFRTDLGDIDALAASIEANGLLHPIVVDSDNKLVAGERRLAAVAALGWVRVPVRVIDPVDLLTAERDENAVRKDFTPTEMAAIAAAIRPVEEALARERQVANLRQGDSRPETVSERATPMDRGDSRERVAAAVGTSFTTLQRIEDVIEAAEEGVIPQEVVEEMDQTGVVAPAYRQVLAARGKEEATDRKPAGGAPRRGRADGVTKRPPPRWRRHFTTWCRHTVREDRRLLLEMDAELHKALRALGIEEEDGR